LNSVSEKDSIFAPIVTNPAALFPSAIGQAVGRRKGEV